MAAIKPSFTGTTYLYPDRPHGSLDLQQIKNYLDTLGIPCELKGDFYGASNVPPEVVAKRLAASRIKDLRTEGALNFQPTNEDLQAELGILSKNEPTEFKRNLSNIYDAFTLSGFMKSSVGGGLHIVFTSRMFATYEGRRYHGRVIFMDYPLAVISTTGIVEAPAKPPEYYAKLAAFNSAKEAGYNLPDISSYEAEVKDELKGSFIDYNDPAMTKIIQGYVLQAVFYFLFGEAFCPDPDCVLYNAHTQEGLINAQIISGSLCGLHKRFL